MSGAPDWALGIWAELSRNSNADLSPLWLFRASSVSEWDQALSVLAKCPTHLTQLPAEVEGRWKEEGELGKRCSRQTMCEAKGRLNTMHCAF